MARHILTTFDRYQRERTIFVNAVADYAREEKNVQALVAAGGVTLLRECAQDTVPRWVARMPAACQLTGKSITTQC